MVELLKILYDSDEPESFREASNLLSSKSHFNLVQFGKTIFLYSTSNVTSFHKLFKSWMKC